MSRTYAMLDLEFTSLDLSKAHLTEWAIVVFNPVTFKPTLQYSDNYGVVEKAWNPETLAWAKTNLAPEVLEMAVYPTTPPYYMTHRKNFMQGLFDSLKDLAHHHGRKDFYLIVNHPECDITLLKNLFAQNEEPYPIHYQNHKDMDSLMMAAAGPLYDDTYAAWETQKGKGVPHTALEDCLIQINKLKFFGVELP